MTTDIFITAPLKHCDWLVCCLRSIEKHCSGFRGVVFLGDKAGEKTWRELAVRFPFLRMALIEERGVGHMFQNWAKTTAYQWTDADRILYVDSDCLFKRNATPDDFLKDGKPLVVKAAYAKLQHAHVAPDRSTHPVPWQSCTVAAMGLPVEFEYMRISGQLYPRWLPMKAVEHLERHHGMTAEAYILGRDRKDTWPHWGYSEFNYLGAYAERFHPDDFTFHDMDKDGDALYETWPIVQLWTYGNPHESPWKERIEQVLGSV